MSECNKCHEMPMTDFPGPLRAPQGTVLQMPGTACATHHSFRWTRIAMYEAWPTCNLGAFTVRGLSFSKAHFKRDK